MQGKRVLQLGCPQITPGFSGAPVFDTVNRRVVGMVTAITSQDEHGRMGETAFITPVETLRTICPRHTLSDVHPIWDWPPSASRMLSSSSGEGEKLKALLQRVIAGCSSKSMRSFLTQGDKFEECTERM